MSISNEKSEFCEIKDENLTDFIKLEKTECKLKIENDPVGELLGSVTTQNCPGVRTSARVIQKMKQDSIRPATPPPSEKDVKLNNDKPIQKTPSQPRSAQIWTNLERNLFFDALNEYGKDFEAIANFINTKLKRKSITDLSFKTKEQIRHIYYQQFHKVTKYIKFSDEVKKPAQELYALINYGEMRRRLQFMSDKNCMKIKDLVYKGHVTVRNKGKNIRIRTPSCKALRKLNQLEDWLEDIKLPLKVEVWLRPANMISFGHVQTIAQNPLVRITVPLQKKLINILRTFEQKWRSAELKLAEEAQKIKPSTSAVHDRNISHSPLCIIPHHDSVIHRPIISIAEFLSSYNICLNSYEKRIGVTTKSETLCHERLVAKRQRFDSGSEKRSPESKKIKSELVTDTEETKPENLLMSPTEISDPLSDLGDAKMLTELGDEIEELLSDDVTDKSVTRTDGGCVLIVQPSTDLKPPTKKSRELKTMNRRKDIKKDIHTFRPLVSEEVLKKIRKGWTISDAGDITVGDLYVVFGADTKLMLEYYWKEDQTVNSINYAIVNQKPNGMPYSLNDCEESAVVKDVTTSNLGNKLKHLLLIANLSDRVRKRQCSCGHSCDKTVRARVDNELASKSFVSNKTVYPTNSDKTVFRQPMSPFRRPTYYSDSVNQPPNNIRYKQFRQRGGLAASRQVVVQRILPCQRGLNQTYDVMEVSHLKNNHAERNLTLSTVESIAQSSVCQDFQMPNPMNNHDSESTNVQQYELPNASIGHIDNVIDDEDNFNVGDKEISSTSARHNGINTELSSNLIVPLDDNTSDSSFSITPLSPFHLLRDVTSETRWIEENLNDISMSSLLGHLDAINSNRDDHSNISVLNESSIDYMTKFAEITASMQQEEKDL